MLEEIREGRNKLTYRIYLSLVLLVTLVLLPAKELSTFLRHRTLLDDYGQLLSRGPSEEASELELSRLYALLCRNPYRGTW